MSPVTDDWLDANGFDVFFPIQPPPTEQEKP